MVSGPDRGTNNRGDNFQWKNGDPVYLYLIPLILGYAANLASAFTTAYSRRLGDEWGSAVTIGLRAVLGIPLWLAGLALAVRAGGPRLFEPSILTRGLAGLLIAAGAALIAGGMLSMRRSTWLPNTHDALVEAGLYKSIRHPMDAGTLVGFAGLFVLAPTAAVGAACGLGVVWIALQTHCEELDLLQRLPAYRDYMRRVPGIIPRLGAK